MLNCIPIRPWKCHSNTGSRLRAREQQLGEGPLRRTAACADGGGESLATGEGDSDRSTTEEALGRWKRAKRLYLHYPSEGGQLDVIRIPRKYRCRVLQKPVAKLDVWREKSRVTSCVEVLWMSLEMKRRGGHVLGNFLTTILCFPVLT